MQDKNKKTIMPGMFSKKHRRQYFSLAITGALIIYIIGIYLVDIDPFLRFFVCLILIFIHILFSSIVTSPLNKTVWKFNKEINFANFEKEMLEMISHDYLHPDSKSYLQCFYANYMTLYDKEKSLQYFENIKEPKHKAYKRTYDLISLYHSLNKRDEEEFYKKLEQFKIKYPKFKNFSRVETSAIVFLKDEKIDNVEEVYNTVKGSNIQKLINANTLMVYYHTRNDLVKAKLYAQYIIEHGNDLKYTVEKANEIISLE